MKRVITFVAVAMVVAVTLYGQSKMSNYTALLIESRKGAADLKENAMLRTISNVGGREYVDCYVHFEGEIDESVLTEYGATLHCRYEFMNMATAAVPLEAIEALSEDARIKLVEAGTPVERKMDKARPMSNIDEILDGLAPLTKSYLGRGVVVGVVDGDMQYDHPAFWNQAHNRFRIKRVWNQNKYGTRPTGFDYGKELKDSATIISDKYDVTRMTSGHATHVAGIAVGADHTKNYYGAAQEADIVFVSSDAITSTSISDGVKYCFDYAKSVGKPCVVNVSMGSTYGPHDGTSTDSKVIDGLVGAGYIVVGSAGNSGTSKIHAGKVLTAEDSTYTTFLNMVVEDGGLVEVYGDVNQEYTLEVVAYNKDSKSYAYVSKGISKSSGSASVQANPDTVLGNYGRLKCNIVTKRENLSTGRSHMSVLIYNMDSIPKRHNVGLRITSKDSGMVHMWSSEYCCFFTNSNQSAILDGDYEYTVDEPMGVTDGVISVGSYITRSTNASLIVGDLSVFSSHGPTADNRVKPDIAAPGEKIISAYPDVEKISDERYESTTVGGKTYYYAMMQGTSMSSPYCAGVIATWLEADPTLTPAKIRNVFDHTAKHDSYTTYDIPNNKWGYGKLNAYAGLLYVLGLTTKVQDVAETGVIVAYPNPTSDMLHIGLPAADVNVTVTIYDLGGKCVYAEKMDETTAGQDIEISVAHLANGAYIVKVAGERTNDTFKLLKQ